MRRVARAADPPGALRVAAALRVRGFFAPIRVSANTLVGSPIVEQGTFEEGNFEWI